MSRDARRQACVLGFLAGCLALLVLGLPERVGEASAHVPGWARASLSFTLMGLTSAAMLLAWAAMATRMIAWTRKSIIRLDRRAD